VRCRHCQTQLCHTFLDLGSAPPSNAYLNKADLSKPETYYPLKIRVCEQCWLVQTEDYAAASDLFNSEYAYFSSTSTSWLAHSARYAEKVIHDLGLNRQNLVIEIASNDGYLLKNFIVRGIPCLGIEPTASTASVAEQNGIPVLREFFTENLAQELAAEGKQADLIVGNNVYAHVPDINDFTAGLKRILKAGGTITLEFPHLMRLIQSSQFDTIYHEHFSYLSLHTVKRIFKNAGLRIWNVEELTTHGGSLRIYACHDEDKRETLEIVERISNEELLSGMRQLATYLDFQTRVNEIKYNLVEFLIRNSRAGKPVAGYGAAAKGNTLLNYSGVKPDLLQFICDASMAKQGKYMPGSHIPIYPPSALLERKPHYVLLLPWNLKDELEQQLAYVKNWGGELVTAVPELSIL
jgi:SAM-dependent methyltransferase